jgi:predicted transcriptional regulator of viral defense system
MPGEAYTSVLEVATDQFGYVTVEDARDVGVGAGTLHAMVRRGTAEHVAQGLYRIRAIPPSPLSEYMEASLWPRGVRGVVSHESALAVHELSDANPARVHITVPRAHRILRRPPRVYQVHHADLDPAEIEHVEGIPVTGVTRTILDCHATHVGAELLRQAIDQARQRGRLSAAQARELARRITESEGEGARG